MRRDVMPWLLALVVGGAALLAVLLIAPERGPGEVDHPDATTGGLPVSTTGNLIGAVQAIGGRDTLGELVGERVELTVDIGQAVNDVAFWVGPGQDELLAVMNRGRRTGPQRQSGNGPSDRNFTVPPRGLVTVRGTIQHLPYAEAMHSWGLTRRDVALVQERGVYLLVDELVSPQPFPAPPHSAERVDEFGRETAPPPGEEVETPLDLPPPAP